MKTFNDAYPRWPSVALGAICGLIFSAIVEVAMEIDEEATQRELAEIARQHGIYIDLTYMLEWWVMPAYWILLLSIVSYVVHRVLDRRTNSPIVIWSIIGLIAGEMNFLGSYCSLNLPRLFAGLKVDGFRGVWGQLPDLLSLPGLDFALLILAALFCLLFGGVVRIARLQHLPLAGPVTMEREFESMSASHKAWGEGIVAFLKREELDE